MSLSKVLLPRKDTYKMVMLVALFAIMAISTVNGGFLHGGSPGGSVATSSIYAARTIHTGTAGQGNSFSSGSGSGGGGSGGSSGSYGGGYGGYYTGSGGFSSGGFGGHGHGFNG